MGSSHTLVHTMLAGGGCIDDADQLRCGATSQVLGHRVMAPSTVGTFLRAFTFGHVRQLDRLTEQVLARAWAAGAGPGDGPMTMDLDSTVCEVHGHAKQGAAYGYTHTLGYLNLPRFPGRFLFAWVAVADGHAQPCLILHRAQVADRGVPPGPVVDGLDPPEHLQAGLLPRAPVAPIDQLALQGGEEALDQGVVEAVAHRPHRCADPQRLQPAAKRQAGELRPLIRMMNQPVVDPAAAPDGQLHRTDRQLGGQVLAHLVADRQPGAAVDDRSQVQRSLVGGQLGVVGVPHAVRLRWAELPATQVRCRRGLGVAAGQARPPSPAPMAAHQPLGAHQPRHPLAADLHATGDLQLGMDPRSAVGATTVTVDPTDLRKQSPIGALAGARATAVPVVEACWGDAHRSAAPPDPVLLAVLIDEPVAGHLVVSLAKNAAACLRISRSIRSSATSRRSRRNSSRSLLVSPSSSPWSMRSWVTHWRSVSRLRPSSRATWVTVLSLERTSATASRRNSAG